MIGGPKFALTIYFPLNQTNLLQITFELFFQDCASDPGFLDLWVFSFYHLINTSDVRITGFISLVHPVVKIAFRLLDVPFFYIIVYYEIRFHWQYFCGFLFRGFWGIFGKIFTLNSAWVR